MHTSAYLLIQTKCLITTKKVKKFIKHQNNNIILKLNNTTQLYYRSHLLITNTSRKITAQTNPRLIVHRLLLFFHRWYSPDILCDPFQGLRREVPYSNPFDFLWLWWLRKPDLWFARENNIIQSFLHLRPY